MWGDRAAARAAVAAALVAVVVAWNVVFDRAIDQGVRQYLQRQERRVVTGGRFVYVQEVMRPAAAAGAVRATLWSLPLAGAGWLIARRLSARSRR